MKTSETIKNIAMAMCKVQSNIKGMTPDAKNPFFKSNYITLDGILEYVRPLLVEEGIWLLQEATGDGEYIEVKTRLIHNTGEFLETDVLRMKPLKNDAQQMGSCITYAKRYQLASLLGISSEVDDDGNKATYGATKPNTGNSTNLTEKQLNRMYAIANEKGLNKEKVDLVIKKDLKKLPNQMSKQEYDNIVARIEKMEGK